MSIPLVVTSGFGNGTFNGTVTDVVLSGFGIGEVIIPALNYPWLNTVSLTGQGTIGGGDLNAPDANGPDLKDGGTLNGPTIRWS